MALPSGGGTAVTKQEPWKPIQDELAMVANRGGNLVKNRDFSYFPGQTYTNMSADTQAGVNALRSASGYGIDDVAINSGIGSLSGKYLNRQPGSGYLFNSLTMSPFSPFQGQLSQYTSGGTTPAMNYLDKTASGGMLNGNPYLNRMFNQAAGNVRSAIDSQFSGAGRYGSGAHQDVMAKNYNDLATNIFGGNYAQERLNQLNAANSIQGAYDNSQGRGLQSIGLGQSALDNALGRNLSAADSLNQAFDAERGRMTQALALSPSLDAMRGSDAQRLLQAGSITENQQMKQIQDAMNRHQFGQQAPWMELSNLQSLLGGLPLAGMGNSYQPVFGGSPIAGGIGGGLAGLGIAGSLPGTILGGIPGGAGTLGILGALGGIFS